MDNDELMCNLAKNTREGVACSISKLPCPRGSVLGDSKKQDDARLAVMLYIAEVLGNSASCEVTFEDSAMVAKRGYPFTQDEMEAIRNTLPKNWEVAWNKDEKGFGLIRPVRRAQFAWPKRNRGKKGPDVYDDQRISHYDLQAVAHETPFPDKL